MTSWARQPTSRQATLPDRIADELIARIFTGGLVAGQTLPPERKLAEELGVDRTSLRSALRQLTRMNLLRPVRGSGVTVLDYRTHAGLDFLSAVLEIPGLELGGAFLLEALDHWNAIMPAVTASAFARATPDTLRTLDDMLARQLQRLDQDGDLDAVARIEVDMQDFIIELTGDLTLQLAANSTRPLRRKLTELQLHLVDAHAQVTTQRAQLRAALGRGSRSTQAIRAHAEDLKTRHAQLRAHLSSLPPNPSRSTQWDKPQRPLSGGRHAARTL